MNSLCWDAWRPNGRRSCMIHSRHPLGTIRYHRFRTHQIWLSWMGDPSAISHGLAKFKEWFFTNLSWCRLFPNHTFAHHLSDSWPRVFSWAERYALISGPICGIFGPVFKRGATGWIGAGSVMVEVKREVTRGHPRTGTFIYIIIADALVEWCDLCRFLTVTLDPGNSLTFELVERWNKPSAQCTRHSRIILDPEDHWSPYFTGQSYLHYLISGVLHKRNSRSPWDSWEELKILVNLWLKFNVISSAVGLFVIRSRVVGGNRHHVIEAKPLSINKVKEKEKTYQCTKGFMTLATSTTFSLKSNARTSLSVKLTANKSWDPLFSEKRTSLTGV